VSTIRLLSPSSHSSFFYLYSFSASAIFSFSLDVFLVVVVVVIAVAEGNRTLRHSLDTAALGSHPTVPSFALINGRTSLTEAASRVFCLHSFSISGSIVSSSVIGKKWGVGKGVNRTTTGR
jgi:hypothetical protein